VSNALRGKFFHSYVSDEEQQQYINPPTRIMEYHGQVLRQAKNGVYLVRLANALALVGAGIVDFDKQILVPVEKMIGWDFYDSQDDWAAAFNENARRLEGFEWKKKNGGAA
jgi:hypothetical protein